MPYRSRSRRSITGKHSGRGVSREESGAPLQRHGLAVHLRGYETLVFDRIEPALEVPLDGVETEVIAPQGTVLVAADGGWVEPDRGLASMTSYVDAHGHFYQPSRSTCGRRPGMSSRAPRRFVIGNHRDRRRVLCAECRARLLDDRGDSGMDQQLRVDELRCRADPGEVGCAATSRRCSAP